MTWFIRQAEESDARRIAALNEVVQLLHHERRPDRFMPPDSHSVLPIVKRWFTSDGVRVWVAEERTSMVIGYVVAIRHDRPGHALVKPATVVELDQLVVAVDARGHAVGTALSEQVLGWAVELCADRVELSAWAFNQGAQAVFARLGFSVDFIRMSRTTTS